MKANPGYRRLIFMVLFLILFRAGSFGEEFSVPACDYSLDLPEGWTLFEASDPALLSFTDPAGSAVLQVFSYLGDSYQNATDMYRAIKARLSAEGEGESFLYSGRDAFLCDLNFNTGSIQVRGYLLFVEDEIFDYALLAFTSLATYEKNHDQLLSCLDSFSIGPEGQLEPGPISQYYYPFPGKKSVPIPLLIDDDIVTVPVDEQEIEATQVLIEREARVLLQNIEEHFIKAWQRYYRLIYRDNFLRLKDYAALLGLAFGFDGRDPETMVKKLLGWIQEFRYCRTGTLSDLASPLATAVTLAGDCDSRALLFVLLLNHLGIDSILLVSTEYSHCAVGIDLDGPGARIAFEGRDYLFAEVSKSVGLGLVAREMADPAGWIGIRLAK